MAGLADKRPARKALSQSILEMKFMQKSREAARQEAEALAGEAACASELTEAMRRGGIRTVVEPSFAPCEALVSPRQSFHGANPEVEKLMHVGKGPVKELKAEPDADVSAAEVARVTHAGTKLQPPRKKQRFLKPADD